MSLTSSKKRDKLNDGELAGFAAIKTGVQDRDERDEAVQKCYAMNSWPELRSGGLNIRLLSRHAGVLCVSKDYKSRIDGCSVVRSICCGCIKTRSQIVLSLFNYLRCSS